MLLAALLSGGLALAAETIEPLPPRWEPHYEDGARLARAGAIAGPAGIAGGTVGFILLFANFHEGEPALAVAGLGLLAAGGIALEAGAPLMATGSLRAADALRAGGQPVGIGLGRAARVMWLGHLATAIALPPVSPALLLGSYGAGYGQMIVNRRGHAALLGSAQAPAVRVAVVPREGGSLLVISGDF